ncbi:MAG: hypothetical protein HXY23_03070 [Parvularculaceae bacterium]|nr:hypothetical protein [Parvularculaceae bacterium]
MKHLAATAAALSTLAAAHGPLACDAHDKAAVKVRPQAGASFGAAPPTSAPEGHVWIDARSGAQYERRGAHWVVRSRPLAEARSRGPAL